MSTSPHLISLIANNWHGTCYIQDMKAKSNYGQPEVGIPLGGVAEHLSNRGVRHGRTGSAGASSRVAMRTMALTMSHHPSQGGRLVGGPKITLRLPSLLAGRNPATPVHHFGVHYG